MFKAFLMAGSYAVLFQLFGFPFFLIFALGIEILKCILCFQNYQFSLASSELENRLGLVLIA